MNANEAYALAQRAHFGQLYGGRPYFDAHVREVARRVLEASVDEDAVVVAWLHDVIEDTPYMLHHLASHGLTVDQQRALRAITRELGEDYPDYLVRVKANPIAALVKRCDLEANLAAAATLTDTQRRRYEAALQWLTGGPSNV